MSGRDRKTAAELLAHYLKFGLEASGRPFNNADFCAEVDGIIDAIIEATIEELQRRVTGGRS